MNRILELCIYLFEKCIHFFEQSAEKLGIPFLIGGFIGALVNRMRKRMTWKKFFASVFTAMFVGWVVGISLSSLFDFQTPFVYAICSMAGAFSEDLLDEVEKLIDNLSEIIKKKIE
ncbi:phage holin family protein [Empedobacter sp. UBA5637]|uniref:phage holin family protein n=1 Tax=Empedobacter sp. UBA5637 TaxID=1946442 RepID=UPI0025C3DB1A|nr:phage holin family protein [Empedobacter sp. UBA5637]